MRKVFCLFILLLVLSSTAFRKQENSYQYFRSGNSNDAETKASFGLALMGGGKDLDEAFRWLCGKGNGGDFLILRANGDDDYNPYVNKLCHTNSVATLIIPDRATAQAPQVAQIIGKAEAVFIAGGNQANYTLNWKGTPVEDVLNSNIAAAKPIGGTSAGLAVLGEYIYSAEGDKPDDPDLSSADVLNNPFNPRVILRRDFLHIELLRNTLTDTHFVKRDRMGRTLDFLARVITDGWSRDPKEIAVDERNAVLVEPSGDARIVGSGKGAYFLSAQEKPEVCRPATPLTFQNVQVYHAQPGSHFNLKQWRGAGGTSYSLSIVAGRIQSSQLGGQIY